MCHRDIRSGSVCDLCLTVERLLRLVRDPARPYSTEGFVVDRLRSVYGELLDYIERFGRETLGLAPLPKQAATPASSPLPAAPGGEVNSTPVASGGGEALLEAGEHTPEERGVDRGRDRPKRRRRKETDKSKKSPKPDKKRKHSPTTHPKREHSAHRDQERHHKDKQRDRSPARVKRESGEHPPAHPNQDRSPLPRTRSTRGSRSPQNRGGRASSSGRGGVSSRVHPRSPERALSPVFSEEGSEEELRTEDEEIKEEAPRYRGFQGKGWGWRDHQEELRRKEQRARDSPPKQRKKKAKKKNKGIKKRERHREWLRGRRG